MASPRISITSTYYECFWVLSVSVRVGRHQLKMETPRRNQTPILRYRDVTFTSEYLKDSLSAVCSVLGVHNVARVRQGPTVLFEVDFSEENALEKFCRSLSNGTIQNRLKEKFKEKTDREVELMLKLHLILPNAEKKSPVSREVTEDNYQECVSLLRESALFDFESLNIAHDVLFEEPTQQEEFSIDDLRELLQDLNEMAAFWFTVGIYLKIHYSKLMVIQKDNPNQSTECLTAMLVTWLKGTEALPSLLVHALRSAGMSVLAKKMAVKHGVTIADQTSVMESRGIEPEVTANFFENLARQFISQSTASATQPTQYLSVLKDQRETIVIKDADCSQLNEQLSGLKEKEEEVTKTVQEAKSTLESVKTQIGNLIYEQDNLIKKREMKKSSKLWLMKQKSSTSGQDLDQINRMVDDVDETVSELSRQINELEMKIKAQNRHAEQMSAQLVLKEEKKKQLEIEMGKIQKEKLDLESELERDRKSFEGEMQRIMHKLQISEEKVEFMKCELDHKKQLELIQAKNAYSGSTGHVTVSIPLASEQRHSIAIPSAVASVLGSPRAPPPAPPVGASDEVDSIIMNEPESLTDCGWYWGNLSREDVNHKLKDAPDGTFLVRDSLCRQGEFTLTVRKGGQNKLIRIMNINGKYGFADPGQFNSVPELVNYFKQFPLTKYIARSNITLDHPVSRFARIEDGEEGDDPEEDLDNDVEELLDKLKEVTLMFNDKNDHYLRLEEDFEAMKMELDEAQASFNASNIEVDMFQNQMDLLKQSGTNDHLTLQDADRRKVIDTIKTLQDRHQEATRARMVASQQQHTMNNRFRNLDRELNMIRPEMMRLQWERDQYNSKLLQEGLSQHYITEQVQDRAATESESIYGTLYGTLEDSEDDEACGLYEDPSNPFHPPMPTPAEPTYEQSMSLASAGSGPVSPPRYPSVASCQRTPAPVPMQHGMVPELQMTMSMSPVVRRIEPRMTQVTSSIEERPHNRLDTWYIECDRAEAWSWLRGKPNGTFLCRPSGKAQQNSKGGLHTHTIDIVYDGIKHLKVVQHNNKYGFSLPCQYQSLLDLVLSYSAISLETHNPKMMITLAYPLHST